MKNQCTCTKDKEATCIVHPTTRSLKEYIVRLEATIAELKEAMTGWEGYAHKDGEYVDDVGEYFAALPSHSLEGQQDKESLWQRSR